MAIESKAPARDIRIDALKFYAIALVVVSHTLNHFEWSPLDDRLVAAIVTFNIPLFMLLSGYVLFGREGHNQSSFIWKKFRTLMVPRYAWIMLYTLINGATLADLPLRLLRATFYSNGLWFLYVLFLFFVVFSATRLLPASDTAFIALAVIPTLIRLITPTSTTLLGFRYAYLMLYFAAGYMLAKYREQLSGWRTPTLTIAPVAFALLLILAPPTPGPDPAWYPVVREYLHSHDLRGSYLLVVLYRTILPTLGIAASWSLYSILPRAVIKPQAWAGQRSLGVYLSEGLFVSLVIGSGLLGMLSTSIAIIACALILCTILEKIPVAQNILLGKPWPRQSLEQPGSSQA